MKEICPQMKKLLKEVIKRGDLDVLELGLIESVVWVMYISNIKKY